MQRVEGEDLCLVRLKCYFEGPKGVVGVFLALMSSHVDRSSFMTGSSFRPMSLMHSSVKHVAALYNGC